MGKLMQNVNFVNHTASLIRLCTSVNVNSLNSVPINGSYLNSLNR